MKITIHDGNKEVRLSYTAEKVLLAQALDDAGIRQSRPCGGQGVCGKCRVLANGKSVLACTTYATKDTYIHYIRKPADIQGITAGYMDNFLKHPLVRQGYGLAVDIGTTTIAAYLYKFPECQCQTAFCVPNTQAQFGADVISRIDFCGNGGLETLHQRITDQIKRLAAKTPVAVYVITGNTAMLHILRNLDPSGLAAAPFIPESLFGEWVGSAYITRCVSAYVGGDLVMAILASGMLKKRTALLADIGTNGEMGLWHNGTLLCCSAAAGPAFEGAGISQGMTASPGAISKVWLEENRMRYETIDSQKPAGICGTGLLDAVWCMRKLGVLDETGYLAEDYEIGDSGVYITPEDIRQVQLAKAAIRAGIDTLLYMSKIEAGDLEKFYIAGGFGSFIDQNSAAGIGLIPKACAARAEAVGNGAGAGAAMVLQSWDCLEQSEKIADMARTVELSGNAYFMERYVESMLFETGENE